MQQAADDYYESIEVHIRWPEGHDLVLSMSPKETVSTLKQKIQSSTPHASGKNIRLIRNGRILNDRDTLADYGIGKLDRDPNSKAKVPPPSPVYIHCSLSDYIPNKHHHNNEPQLRIPTGFDRLREAGFSEEDIQGIRSRFHRIHGTVADENSEDARNLEEQWIDNSNETLADGSVQGTYKEMVWGLILGFFLGVICLFWFRESVFTRRHQMGIVAGMLINISFGILHVYY
ncbi:hypothetical protein O0I10_000506 [Lichtheimia ornata]|uniref:Ubiquitin-like domain-containing protein n=1 Tax=Lichtheimia ornata TaxID=688661 RepID=A0AAD7Y3S6_9FUNG|nr:uncharacterized protein O0I10_000506 [Lichtheimia ornata]KAJ8663268.1 hypothetical protein O0I10_000506 [Lichtheimia ornata]